MKVITAFFISLFCIQLYACDKNEEIETANNSNIISNTDSMKITIGTNIFKASLYDNATATAFKAKLPLTVDMSELNRNEKYFDLPNSLPTNASNPGTIQT